MKALIKNSHTTSKGRDALFQVLYYTFLPLFNSPALPKKITGEPISVQQRMTRGASEAPVHRLTKKYLTFISLFGTPGPPNSPSHRKEAAPMSNIFNKGVALWNNKQWNIEETWYLQK